MNLSKVNNISGIVAGVGRVGGSGTHSRKRVVNNQDTLDMPVLLSGKRRFENLAIERGFGREAVVKRPHIEESKLRVEQYQEETKEYLKKEFGTAEGLAEIGGGLADSIDLTNEDKEILKEYGVEACYEEVARLSVEDYFRDLLEEICRRVVLSDDDMVQYRSYVEEELERYGTALRSQVCWRVKDILHGALEE